MRTKFKYLPLVLAMVLLASSFSASFMQVAFTVNRDYIIRELCVNRSKPQMHCNGKCYLKKQIKKNQEKHAPVSSQQPQTETLNWLFTGNVVVEFDNNSPQSDPVSYFSDFLSIGFILAVNHPPPFSA